MSPATPSFKRIHFVASPIPDAKVALDRLAARYGNVAPQDADVIVALGGDGLMLQTLHRFMTMGKPIYGMHRGTVGFLMNEFYYDDLPDHLAKARVTVIHPLLMRAHDDDGDTIEFHAFNEVSLFRQTYQAARLRILDRRRGAAQGTGRRRRVAGDAGRIDGVQSFRPGADHPDQRVADGTHADQPVPAAALARRAAARHRARAHRRAGAGEASGRGRRRP